MIIRIHKRTIAIFAVAVLVFTLLPHFPARQSATETGAEITDWGLGFKKEGEAPVGNASSEYLRGYDSYYVDTSGRKVIYLTFDAGYENGNMPKILDTLKAHNVPAAFFLVGNFLDREPDLVRRMEAEGHIVGNHTMSHPDMSKISDTDSFREEIAGLEEKYKAITGKEMKKFYRPPQGKFSASNLKMAQELGYKTIFWSLAYVDWLDNKQPSHDEAINTLTRRIHPGAIVLLHSTSKTNAEILDTLLTKWKGMGYTFESLKTL